MIEEMRTLPNGWSRSEVGSLCKMIRGVSYPKVDAKKQLSKGYYPILRGGNIQDEIIFKDLVFVPSKYIKDEQYIKRFDVVLAMSSGSRNIVGKAAQAKEDCKGSFGAFCGLLRPNKQIEPRFFGYYFKTKDYRTKISNLSAGVNINNLRRGYIENLSIPLPPLPEQKRIIAKIENLLDRLNKTKQELAKIPPILKKFRQSVLAEAFSGELTREWRERRTDLEPASKLLERIREERKKKLGKKYKESEPIDTSDLSELPEGWKWVSLKEICNIQSGNGFPVKYQGLKMGDYPFAKVADLSSSVLNNKGILETAENYISKNLAKNLRVTIFPKGTTIFAKIGEAIRLNRRATLGRDAAVDNNVMGLILFSLEIGHFWLFYFMNTIDLIDYSQATTVPSVRKSTVENIMISLPPKKEMYMIVKKIRTFFAQADTIEKSVKIAQAHCEKLTQSILAKAFRGELVEQDPNDEPAEDLMNKLRNFCKKTKSSCRVNK